MPILDFGMDFIDLKSQQARIRQDIDRRISAVLDHGQYILGPEVFELEERLQDFLGVRHAITAASGTDTLLIALMALGIGPGDEVITTPYTWISPAEMIALLGAKPVFVEIQPDTWNIDPDHLAGAINERTKAIIPVSIYGQPADLTAINRIAKDAGGIPVIEDAAQSFGATHHGRRSGALSLIGSTSFFPSKPLGCYGEGGALFTDDDELAERMRWIRLHGQERKYHHPIVGINGRLDTIQAAILLAKMEIFEEEIALRQSVADGYAKRLADSVLTLPVVAEGNTSVYAQYTVLSSERDALQARLNAAGIPSVAYYSVPLHLQPVFSGSGYHLGDFPITERTAAAGLSLPMSAYLTSEAQDRIAEVILQ